MPSMAATSSSFDGRSMIGDVGAAVCFSTIVILVRSLLHHVGVETDRSVWLDLAVKALHLRFEARKQIGTLFEHLEVVQHRLGLRTETFARHDRRDTGWID